MVYAADTERVVSAIREGLAKDTPIDITFRKRHTNGAYTKHGDYRRSYLEGHGDKVIYIYF